MLEGTAAVLDHLLVTEVMISGVPPSHPPILHVPMSGLSGTPPGVLLPGRFLRAKRPLRPRRCLEASEVAAAAPAECYTAVAQPGQPGRHKPVRDRCHLGSRDPRRPTGPIQALQGLAGAEPRHSRAHSRQLVTGAQPQFHHATGRPRRPSATAATENPRSTHKQRFRLSTLPLCCNSAETAGGCDG